MNLSNYLQMPPAPSVPQTPQTGPAKGAAAVVGLDSAGNLKLDFAQIMARQFEQMPQLKRQDLAATSSLPKLASLPKDPHEQAHVDASRAPALDRASNGRANVNDAALQKTSRDESDELARQNKRARPQDDEPKESAWFNQAAAMPAPVLQDHGDDSAASGSADDATPLQTVSLSEQTKLITDPRHAPSPQSLLAFAQSMGMDPEAIGQLMGAADAAQLANATSGNSANSAAQMAAHMGQTLAPQTGAAQLQAHLQAAMQANGLGGQVGDAAAMVTSLTATHIQAQGVGTPSQAVHMPPTALSTLQMLQPADPNAALQNMAQVGVLPAAPMMASAQAAGASFNLITLHSADLPESQITALAGLLAENGQLQDSSLSQEQSSSDQTGGSFAQSMANKAALTEASQRSTAQGVSRPMQEVYDQLSDKLSTEMAARMHEQINSGQWKMKFGLRPAHLGGVEIQLEMKDGKLNAQLNADNPMTREMLQNSTPRLREALANLGLQTDQVTVGQNQSGFAHTGSQGRGSGNQSQVGDNLSSSVSPHETAPERGGDLSNKGSDSLLDLYA